MSRNFKKLSLQYAYLKLELEEIDEEMTSLSKDWSSLFGKYFIQDEVEMWKNEDTGELRDTPPESTDKKKDQKNLKVKKVYRKLSTLLHPDKGGSDEAFDELKKIYEDNDLLGLIAIAADNNVEIKLEEEDLELVGKSIKKLEGKIKKSRMSLIWQYFKGDEIAKNGVISQLEILSGKKINKDKL